MSGPEAIRAQIAAIVAEARHRIKTGDHKANLQLGRDTYRQCEPLLAQLHQIKYPEQSA